MHLAIEKNNKIGFYKIDGRKLEEFIKLAEKVNGTLSSIWSYTHIERKDGETVGAYRGIKIIK